VQVGAQARGGLPDPLAPCRSTSPRGCNLTLLETVLVLREVNGYIPQLGDMIRVDRPLYKHVGIYVGVRGAYGPSVIHNDKGGGVILSSLAEFSGGTPAYLHQAATGNYFDREEIANRAFSLLGRKFDLLTFNCEHAANWAQSAKLESPQLRGAFFLVALFFGLFLITRKA
jgi:hypothetical protein